MRLKTGFLRFKSSLSDPLTKAPTPSLSDHLAQHFPAPRTSLPPFPGPSLLKIRRAFLLIQLFAMLWVVFPLLAQEMLLGEGGSPPPRRFGCTPPVQPHPCTPAPSEAASRGRPRASLRRGPSPAAVFLSLFFFSPAASRLVSEASSPSTGLTLQRGLRFPPGDFARATGASRYPGTPLEEMCRVARRCDAFTLLRQKMLQYLSLVSYEPHVCCQRLILEL